MANVPHTEGIQNEHLHALGMIEKYVTHSIEKKQPDFAEASQSNIPVAKLWGSGSLDPKSLPKEGSDITTPLSKDGCGKSETPFFRCHFTKQRTKHQLELLPILYQASLCKDRIQRGFYRRLR